jgi:hypothetical protein
MDFRQFCCWFESARGPMPVCEFLEKVVLLGGCGKCPSRGTLFVIATAGVVRACRTDSSNATALLTATGAPTPPSVGGTGLIR